MSRSSFRAMLAMFVVAVMMLIGCISIFVTAYRTAENDAISKAAATPTPPDQDPNREQPAPKGATFGDAFALARSNPWFWWTLCCGIVLSGLGVLYAMRKTSLTGEEAEIEDRLWGKLGLFALCSVIGFFTVVCLALPYTWMKSAELLSRDGWKTQEPWLVILAYVIGLGSMFASLLAVKSEERGHVNIRRWIYGYNAFLGGLLFLAIVGVVNAWVALYGPEVSDWTSTNIYSLSPATKRLVKSLDKPVRAYVILPPGSEMYSDVTNLLKNCRRHSDQLEIQELSPTANFKELDQLLKKYDVLRDQTGLAAGLLLVQDPDGAKPVSTFIKPEEIEDTTGGLRGEPAQRFFKGEQALFVALREFKEEKRKVTVYFTQDSGELTVDESAVRGRRDSPLTRSAIGLKQRLEKAGYVVKPVGLIDRDPNSTAPPGIPDDALAVIVADPVRMTSEKAAVLDAYMKRPKKEGVEPGKLIVLLDTRFGADGKVPLTGLESFLMGFGVQVGQDVVYRLAQKDPMKFGIDLPATSDPELSENIVGLLNSQRTEFEINESRSLKTVPAVTTFDTRILLIPGLVRTVQGPMQATWPEDKPIPNPDQYVRDLMRSPELAKKISGNQSLAVGLTVRDQGAQPPPQQPNPFSPPPQGKLGAPRMLVMGDASFAADSEVEKGNDVGANMLVTTLAWLRGKPELGASEVPPKERKSYRMVMSSESLSRAFWLPLVWMLLAVIVTGIGVGILRRR